MIYQGAKRYPVTEAIVHCADTRPEWMAGKASSAKVAEIRLWHTRDRGWKDIGYHWIIDRDGTVLPGRAETVIGAHVAGHNSGTIGICLVGGYGSNEKDAFSKHFTPAQDAALVKLLGEIGKRTTLKKISGHNQYAAKACPGFNVPAWAASHRLAA